MSRTRNLVQAVFEWAPIMAGECCFKEIFFRMKIIRFWRNELWKTQYSH